MGSRNPFRGSYNSKMLALLQEAFVATLADLPTSADGPRDSELREFLARKLISLADEGVTDVAELKRLALERHLPSGGRLIYDKRGPKTTRRDNLTPPIDSDRL
jgi:hypothetical protein